MARQDSLRRSLRDRRWQFHESPLRRPTFLHLLHLPQQSRGPGFLLATLLHQVTDPDFGRRSHSGRLVHCNRMSHRRNGLGWKIRTNQDTFQFFCVLFTCQPIRAQWDLSLTATAKCISTRDVWLGGSIPNVVTDIVLLIMPLPYIWKLNAPVPQKIALAGMVSPFLPHFHKPKPNFTNTHQIKSNTQPPKFLLGCFVAIVSIIRLSVLLHLNLNSTNMTYKFSPVVIWSIVEINCGLICACLPSLRPAIRLLGLSRIFGVASTPLDPSGGGLSGKRTPGPGDSGEVRPYKDYSRRQSWGRGKFGVGKQHRSAKSKDDTILSVTYAGRDEEEEDSYEMIKRTQDGMGLTTTSVEPARSSTSEDRKSDKDKRVPRGGSKVIEIKRDWAIQQEPVQGKDGV
jgi:hypothetical protein